jgi:hypothetical protein
MRLKALVHNDDQFKKIIIYKHDENNVYVFLYTSTENVPSVQDDWYSEVEEAIYWIEQSYGVSKDAWVEIPDPLPGAQQDVE